MIPAARSAESHPGASQLAIGKSLYRQYCGQCHALSQALSAGFGNSGGGLGQNGGPSFNELRIPAIFSIEAVSEPTGGHELVRRRISMSQLAEVATYIAKTTARNPIPGASDRRLSRDQAAGATKTPPRDKPSEQPTIESAGRTC